MKNEQNIEKLISRCCDNLLNDNYREICLKIKNNYLKKIPDGMNRGKAEIWAASIVWAAGSVNFLNDNSYKPYASMEDICSYFDSNKSTVGNRAVEIRKLLKMNNINEDYLLEDSPILDMISSMRVSKEGIIYFANQHENKHEAEYLEDDGSINEFLIEGRSGRSIRRSTYLQYEYMLKKMLNNWIEKDGRERSVRIDFDNDNLLVINVASTMTEAAEMEDWMRKNGLG